MDLSQPISFVGNRRQLAMQRPQPDPRRLPPRAPYPLAPPLGFGSAAALWIGSSSSSQAAAAAAAAKARATEQMAYEDAWKAINPDFRTPFASVEDAVSRLLPYHVFADNGEEDMDDAHLRMTKSSAEKFTDEMEDKTLHMVAEFEKQVLVFNVIARGCAEEQLMLEYGLLHDERCLMERVRALVVQQEQRRRQQEEATRRRMALAQAASAWQLAQEQAQAHALAQARAEALAAAMARGERFPGLAGQRMATPGVAMSRGEGFFPGLAGHPQHDPAAARTWQMMIMMQQQQQHQQQQLGMGVWPTLLEPHGEGTSSGHARARALQQNQPVGQRNQQRVRIAAQQRESASLVSPPQSMETGNNAG